MLKFYSYSSITGFNIAEALNKNIEVGNKVVNIWSIGPEILILLDEKES